MTPEIIGGLIATAIIGAFVRYIISQIKDMKDKQNDLDSRLAVEESKGGQRDAVSAQTLELLGKIHHDISTIKEEQGYWRGKQEGQSTKK